MIRADRKTGFTLLELLVVIGIMGLLATLSIGGYNAATRGMEERGVKESVISLVRLAQQRALIDGVPTMVVFYNRRLVAKADDTAEVCVGEAVAVRMSGRITSRDGSFIRDEFAGWENSYPQDGSSRDPEMRLYCLNGQGGANLDSFSSLVPPYVVKKNPPDQYMIATGMRTNDQYNAWGFELKDGKKDWKAGDAYGFEISHLTLPRNYIFGTGKPTDEKADVASTLYFAPDELNGSQYKFNSFGGGDATVSAIRNGTVVKIHKVTASDLD